MGHSKIFVGHGCSVLSVFAAASDGVKVAQGAIHQASRGRGRTANISSPNVSAIDWAGDRWVTKVDAGLRGTFCARGDFGTARAENDAGR